MGLGAVQMSDMIWASAASWHFVCVVLKGGSTEGRLASVGSLDCGMSFKTSARDNGGRIRWSGASWALGFLMIIGNTTEHGIVNC